MLTQITEHIWFLPREDGTDRPALGFISSGRSSLMVDSGNSPEHISFFYGHSRSMHLPDPEFVVVTCWQWDHVFGLSGSPAKSIAQTITNERLQSMQRLDWSDSSLAMRVQSGYETPFSAEMIKKEMPSRHSFKVKTTDISFDEKMILRIGDINCELIHVGGPHSEDSVVVFVPSEKVLFLGDCYCSDSYNNNSLRLEALSSLILKLDALDAECCVPSHENLMTKAELMERLHHIESIGQLVGDAKNLQDCQPDLEKKLRHKLSPEEIDYAGKFVIGNNTAPFVFPDF